MIDQEPFPLLRAGADLLALNPEPRCPCVLLLDTSASMDGAPIAQLNAAVATLYEDLRADALAQRRVTLGCVEFGPVRLVQAFETVQSSSALTFTAGGDTPMAAAIVSGLGLLEEHKAELRQAGLAYYRPWVLLITDGAPTDDWRRAAALVHAGEDMGKFSFFAVGVDGADMNVLRQLSVRQPLRLSGLRFRELFLWLSASLKKVSASVPGTRVLLDNPAAPDGWASA